MYLDDKGNKGLEYRFSLTPTSSGRKGIRLRGGEQKVEDNIAFILSFSSFKRIYLRDFSPKFLRLLQSTTNVINPGIRGLSVFSVIAPLRKYITFARIGNMNIVKTGRKEITISVDYTYNLSKRRSVNTVTRIIETL
jgi:hypothetical protein